MLLNSSNRNRKFNINCCQWGRAIGIRLIYYIGYKVNDNLGVDILFITHYVFQLAHIYKLL